MQSITLSGGVIVTMPQQVSLDDASRGLAMFNQMKVPVLGVIENMSYLEMPDGTHMDIFGQGGGETLAKSFKVPFLGSIPIDPDVRIGGDIGKPIVYSHPESKAAKALVEVTEKLAAQISIAAFAGAKDGS
jgi:ATP-binding protein involved in chromosome partitioning